MSQKHSKSSTQKRLHQIRSRISRIIDYQLVKKINEINGHYTITLNESRLQQWVQMFKNQILTISNISESKNIQNAMVKIIGNQRDSPKHDLGTSQHIQNMNFPQPELLSNQLLIYQGASKLLKIYKKYSPQHVRKNCANKALKDQTANDFLDKINYQFPKHMNPLKSNCTSTFISNKNGRNSVVFIGGCKSSNPNIKSSKITTLDLQAGSLSLISRLPYGLSSHCSIHHPQSNSIFIIGGNKDNSIVTRGCFKLNLNTNNVQEISCLNYPAASTTCLLYKQKCIYKFGGVGYAFGDWNTSPYIQRYCIKNDQWQVINPILPPQFTKQLDQLDSNNSLLSSVKCHAYICQNGDIFVFGGYDIQGNPIKFGYTLKIYNKQELKQCITEDQYQIQAQQQGYIIENFVDLRNNYDAFQNSFENWLIFVQTTDRNYTAMIGLKHHLKYEHNSQEFQAVQFHQLSILCYIASTE